jgi:thioesterase domain-containing protein
MKAAEIEAYLHGQIPLSSHMGVRVLECDETGARLSAPLAPNINHRATVFGGSASALAILAAWTWLHFSLRRAGVESRLVIQRNSIDYLRPITSEFEALCPALPSLDLERFLLTLARRGKARAILAAELMCAGERVAAFTGEYVALKLKTAEV